MATRPEAATASAHDVRCSAAHPSSRSQDRTVRQRCRGSEQPVPGPAPLASKYTTPPRRVRRAARVSACPHRYRLHCCDIAATAGARHITVAGRRPEGFRCGGFGGHLTAPRTSATPVSACTEVSGWRGGGRVSFGALTEGEEAAFQLGDGHAKVGRAARCAFIILDAVRHRAACTCTDMSRVQVLGRVI